MKKLNIILGAFITLFFSACEGPQGPRGFDGRNGEDGQDGRNGLERAAILEIEGTFSETNEYRIFYEFPNTVEVFETDVVLVYLLWDQKPDANGVASDIWRLLPQTRIVDQGLLQYNYEHTFFDVDIFLETDFDPSLLMPGDTDNQVFRIAVLPAEVSQTGKLDTSNINSVMGALGISESDVQKTNLN